MTRALHSEEVERMKAILREVLVTPRNYPRLLARIIPADQKAALYAGIVISHYAFANRAGQSGYMVISHTTKRAGICFTGERTEWGTWNEETDTIQTDGGRLYSRVGEVLFETETQTEERP
jgi:hypothetical protein